MTAFQRATTMAKRFPSAERSPSMATGRPRSGFSDCQNPILSPGARSAVNSREFQCVSAGALSRTTASSVRKFAAIHARTTAYTASSSVVSIRMPGTAGARPNTSSRLPERSQKRRTLAAIHLPPFPLLKPEGAKETAELRVGVFRRDGRDAGDSLDHSFDCIVSLLRGLEDTRCRRRTIRRSHRGQDCESSARARLRP